MSFPLPIITKEGRINFRWENELLSSRLKITVCVCVCVSRCRHVESIVPWPWGRDRTGSTAFWVDAGGTWMIPRQETSGPHDEHVCSP